MSGTISQWDLQRCQRDLEQVAGRFAPLFGRPEMQAQGARDLRGLMAQIKRKNGWQLAHHIVDAGTCESDGDADADALPEERQKGKLILIRLVLCQF